MNILRSLQKIKRYFYLRFVYKSPKSVFKEIYFNNLWGSSESVSGTGSTLAETKIVIHAMNELILKLNIKSILDIPCGDFHWMSKVDLACVRYIGADIVENLVENNNLNYKNFNISFVVKDLINDPLPQSDLIIVRDCLVHLSNKDIHKAIYNIKNSGSKFLLTTSFPSFSVNNNIITGEWRPLNLQLKPFSLPLPLMTIKERLNDESDIYNSKSLMLWDISAL